MLQRLHRLVLARRYRMALSAEAKTVLGLKLAASEVGVYVFTCINKDLHVVYILPEVSFLSSLCASWDCLFISNLLHHLDIQREEAKLSYEYSYPLCIRST